MASTLCCVRYAFVLVVLSTALFFGELGMAVEPLSFCPRTLSRPTCPDLQTYDQFNISTYGGRWFEIGSSANFKGSTEPGGICVLANYTLLQPPSPGKGAVIGVANTLYSLGANNHNDSQVLISTTAEQICSQAFTICAQVDESSLKPSLARGLAIVYNVSAAIQADYPELAVSLASAEDKVGLSVLKINKKLDILSKRISKIQQLTNGRLGQGKGDVATNVAILAATVAKANSTTAALASAVHVVEKGREAIQKVAAELAKKEGGSAESSHPELVDAAGMILAGEKFITEQLQEIQTSLASMVAASALFLTPSVGEKGYTGLIVGSGAQNATFPGKLLVSFAGFPAGAYWVIAVENEAAGGGYSASLVYGCDQDQGGIEETLILLSRTPSLPPQVVQRLFGKAAKLGVTQDCSTTFIYTVQSEECGNPPAFTPPNY